MNKVIRIMRHEFKLATANKAYVILTLLGPFLILAITVLPSLMAQDPGSMAGGKPVALYGAPEPVARTLSSVFSGTGVDTLQAESLDAGKQMVLDGKVVGVLALESSWPDGGKALWYSATGAEAAIFETARAVLSSLAREYRIAASGIPAETVTKILAEPAFEVVRIDSGGAEETRTQDSFVQVLFTAMSFVMMIYMTVLLYGQMIGRSVVTEKTSKTVEVMLSSVTSGELMYGKILGLGLAGILQYGVWAGMAALLTRLVGPLFGIALPPGLTLTNVAWLVVFFVLAFFLYASAYAALGAASEDEHHLGQLAWPLLMFLIVPLVMIGALVSNANSPLAVGLSLFPMTSPIVMLIRILVTAPPAWQIVVCIAALVLAVALMAALAAKVFRVGILMTGKRPKIGEILRWIAVK